MATKKKELLEQEAPVSETIALEDSPRSLRGYDRS